MFLRASEWACPRVLILINLETELVNNKPSKLDLSGGYTLVLEEQDEISAQI
jgi:hypothetical protein